MPRFRRWTALTAVSLISAVVTINSGVLAASSLLMAMMDDDATEMGSMGASQPSSMPEMGGMSAGSSQGGMGGVTSGSSSSGMGRGCCMGSMGQAPGAAGTSGMSMRTNLPGFPGASHIYHVGATGFYLEYADKLGLSTEQRTSLNDIKQQALVEQSKQQRKIDEAEQALWLLTAAEQPDAAAIESKIREIEKLKADQRLSFIRAVGDAAGVLTADQRKMVLGMVSMPGSGSSSANALSPAAQRGLTLVRANCARCHEIDKTAKSPLALRTLQERYPVENLQGPLAAGRITSNHPMTTPFDAAQAADVIAYLKSLNP